MLEGSNQESATGSVSADGRNATSFQRAENILNYVVHIPQGIAGSIKARLEYERRARQTEKFADNLFEQHLKGAISAEEMWGHVARTIDEDNPRLDWHVMSHQLLYRIMRQRITGK